MQQILAQENSSRQKESILEGKAVTVEIVLCYERQLVECKGASDTLVVWAMVCERLLYVQRRLRSQCSGTAGQTMVNTPLHSVLKEGEPYL